MPRALLTDREQEIISGNADVKDEYRYQLVSRIRNRMERLNGDIEAMEAHGDLADEFREMICDSYVETNNGDDKKIVTITADIVDGRLIDVDGPYEDNREEFLEIIKDDIIEHVYRDH